MDLALDAAPASNNYFFTTKRFAFMLTLVLATIGVPLVIYISILGLGIYISILGVLITFPSLQAYIVYLHKATLTSKDLNVPEQFGFLHNQAVPFYIETIDGNKIHAWHIVPSGLYGKNEENLQKQVLSGPVGDITQTLNFSLLQDNPEARLVVYMHGTSGTLGSTIRPASYCNVYSAAPNHIHVLAFDYRGYGLSTGAPSELGLLSDALEVMEWAMNTAEISPDRIVIYGQSLGSAVAVSVAKLLAIRYPGLSFAGLVVSASFSDLPSLTATYKIGGMIPILAPVAVFPSLFRFFASRLQDTWLVKERIAELVRHSGRHDITLIHAEDDDDIPAAHTHELFWHAVNATSTGPISLQELEEDKARRKLEMGSGGWYVDWVTPKGTIRMHILKHGKHDWQMTYPVTSLAILRAFQSTDPDFGA